MQHDIYKDYVSWKGWDNFFKPTEQEKKLYAKELKRIQLFDKDIIDIGFGSGALLAWAKQQGGRPSGVEIQPELRAAAKKFEIQAYPSIDIVPDSSFDVVTAFDVLEHVKIEDLPDMLKQLIRIARPGATIVVRVPNCQSPAGLVYQFGDPTHVTMLSGPLVQSFMDAVGFTEISYREAVKLASTKRINRWLRFIIQPLIRFSVLLYRINWSMGSVPLSPNVIVQAKKPFNSTL